MAQQQGAPPPNIFFAAPPGLLNTQPFNFGFVPTQPSSIASGWPSFLLPGRMVPADLETFPDGIIYPVYAQIGSILLSTPTAGLTQNMLEVQVGATSGFITVEPPQPSNPLPPNFPAAHPSTLRPLNQPSQIDPNQAVPRTSSQAGTSSSSSQQLSPATTAKGWNKPYYYVTPASPFYYCGEEIKFVVQGFSEYPEEHDAEGFDVKARNQYGDYFDVLIRRDRTKPNYYNGVFFPGIPGIYRCSIRFQPARTSLHITGSPFEVAVSRNYETSNDCQVIALLPLITRSEEIKLWGMCIDKKTGVIYIADKFANKIHLISSITGMLISSFGGYGGKNGKFYRPTGIAMDEVNQRIIISDKNNHRICFHGLNGRFIGTFGRQGRQNGQFLFPYGVAVSPDCGRIVVADTRNNRIQLFNASGQFLQECSNYIDVTPLVEANIPSAVAFDLTGTKIYVSDFSLHTVAVISLDFSEKCYLIGPGQVGRTSGLIVDAAGNILIGDTKRNCIRVVSPNGHLLHTIFGSEIAVKSPLGLATMKAGELLILDGKGTVKRY